MTIHAHTLHHFARAHTYITGTHTHTNTLHVHMRQTVMLTKKCLNGLCLSISVCVCVLKKTGDWHKRFVEKPVLGSYAKQIARELYEG